MRTAWLIYFRFVNYSVIGCWGLSCLVYRNVGYIHWSLLSRPLRERPIVAISVLQNVIFCHRKEKELIYHLVDSNGKRMMALKKTNVVLQHMANHLRGVLRFHSPSITLSNYKSQTTLVTSPHLLITAKNTFKLGKNLTLNS